MIDTIDLILKLIAFASLSAVTMVSFESVRNIHRLFKSEKFLHYSLLVMWLSGGSLILMDGYINSKSKSDSITAFKNQIETHKRDENKADSIHKRDEAKADNTHKNDSINASYRHALDSINNIQENKSLKDSIRLVRLAFEKEDKDVAIPKIDFDYNGTNPMVKEFRHYLSTPFDSISLESDITNNTEYDAENLIDKVIIITVIKHKWSIFKEFNNTISPSMILSKGNTLYCPYIFFTRTTFPDTAFIYVKIQFTNMYDIKQKPFWKIIAYTPEYKGKALHEAENYYQKRVMDTLKKLNDW